MRTITLILAAILAAAGAAGADNHRPVFTWQVRGGVVHSEQWIYDGETPIARFDNSIVEQPAQMLMFFNRVPRPVILRDVKLTPDGAPLIGTIQLFEKPNGIIITDQLRDVIISGEGTNQLEVVFVTEDANGVARSRRTLTLTYDNTRETYVYDFQGELTFLSPEVLNGGRITSEFSDPWFTGCPGPALEFPGMWDRRYRHFIHEAPDGSVVSTPINHFTTSYKGNIRLKPDGMFLTAYEPDGNPAIQFVGDTAGNSSISICWWGYDFHFNRSISPDELFGPIRTHFRFFNCPDATVKSLMATAKTPPLNQNEGSWSSAKEFPIYDRNGSFERGILLMEPFDGPIDPFPWQPSGTGAIWDRSTGRTGTSSLKITRTEPGLTRWLTDQGDGAGYFAEPWKPCKGYRVSCWVKTENVTGRGATMGLQYHHPNVTQVLPVTTARRITGTNGWTRLDAEVGPPGSDPTDIGCLMIILQQDGAGTSWFDDLTVTPIE